MDGPRDSVLWRECSVIDFVFDFFRSLSSSSVGSLWLFFLGKDSGI